MTTEYRGSIFVLELTGRPEWALLLASSDIAETIRRLDPAPAADGSASIPLAEVESSCDPVLRVLVRRLFESFPALRSARDVSLSTMDDCVVVSCVPRPPLPPTA